MPDVAIRLSVGRSATLAWIVAASHAGAAICLAVAEVPLALAAPLGVLVGTSALRRWRLEVARSAPDAVVGVRVLADGRWSVKVRNRGWGDPVAVARVATSPLVICARLERGAERVRAVVLARDAVGAAAHRRLRVRLRQSAGAAPPR